mgnify:CR=1 FL=1
MNISEAVVVGTLVLSLVALPAAIFMHGDNARWAAQKISQKLVKFQKRADT